MPGDLEAQCLLLQVNSTFRALGQQEYDFFDRLTVFTQMYSYSLSFAKRGMALTQEEFPAVDSSVAGTVLLQCLKVSCNRFGCWHTLTVTLPPVCRFPSAWLPTSKPSLSSAPIGVSYLHIEVIVDAHDLILQFMIPD